MKSSLETFIDASWNRLTTPPVLAGSAGAIIALLVTSALQNTTPMASALRFISVIALGACFAIGHVIAYAPRGWPRPALALLLRLGVIDIHAFPFFDEELPEVSHSRISEAKRRARVVLFSRGGLFVVTLGAALALVLGSSLTLDHGGYMTLTQGSPTESYGEGVMDSPQRVNLGYRVRLTGVARGETGWTAHLVVTDVVTDNEAAISIAQGETELVRGRLLHLAEVRPTTGVAAVTVRATHRETGAVEEVTLVRGLAVPVGDAETLTLQDASGGDPRMGVSIQVVEHRGDEETRTEWIFQSRPEFDMHHGSGAWALQITGVVPEASVVLAVEPASRRALWWIAIGWLFLTGGLAAASWRGAWTLVGSSGDYRLISVPGLSDGPSAEQLCQSLLTPEQWSSWVHPPENAHEGDA